MIKDLNKAIASISYNHLNLPSLITFSDGNTIQYTYDATGVKLKQTVNQNSITKTTDYVGPFVYERDTLRFFSMPEGRIVNNDGEYEYQFMLKDHLGNIRVLYGNPFEGNNLIANNDANTTSGFPVNQNVTVTSVKQNGETYVKCISNQSTNSPGVYPIGGGSYTVASGEKYTLKVRGYAESNNAFLYVWSAAGDLVWTGSALPLGADNEGWVSNDVTIPAGVTQIKIGVLFANPVVGNAFYLNEVGLYKHQDDDYPAGFEVTEQSNEDTRFLNYHTGKINNSGAYSRTGSSAYRLTASTQISNEVIGPAKSLRVYPGDAVHMEVYGKYLPATSDGTDVGGVIAAALQGAFNLSAGGATDLAFQSISNLFGDGSLIGTAGYPSEDEAAPKAFLNYILFDDNYVPYDFGYDQIGSEGALPGGVDKMSLMAKVRKPGYLYIYLSNENEVAQEVYFDDLAIKHVKGVAIQQSDYYPFGLTFNSYQRENSIEQRWKFQGQEHIDDLGLNWDSFKWRNHQPDIGRFFNMDPISEEYYYNSPYAFSENKVVAHVELEGLESRSSISAEEINGQWTMGSDNHISTEREAKAKIETPKNASSKEKDELISTLTGNLETSVNLVEQDMSSTKEGSVGTVAPLRLSQRTLKGVGFGLSIVNLSFGAIKVQGQIDKGGLKNVNPIDAAQVTVGGVGVFASGMGMLGYGGSTMASVAASANIVGMVLSIPGNWANVYQGAYQLSEQPVTTGDPGTDHMLQLQYNEGFRTDGDYFQN